MTTPVTPVVDVDRARAFIRSEGRLLERRLAEVHLDHDLSAVPAVVAALAAHRNADGGLGHGLEPDVRAPGSQPLFLDFASDVLDSLAVEGGAEVTAAAQDLLGGASSFLAGVATPEGAVPILLPSAAQHPRASHWGDCDVPAGLNPTAALVARFRAFGIEAAWIEPAAKFCWDRIEAPDGVEDAHTALCVLRFLETDPDQDRAESAHAALCSRLDRLAFFQPRPSDDYGLTPLHFAPTPDSPRRRFFADADVDAHLEALAAGQQADGGWPITWEAPGSTAEREWRGVVTLQALRVLAAYAG
ncbi:hypothetical protein [Actinopolymorpha pittospori]